MADDLAEVRSLLTAALDRLAAIEAQAIPTAAERRARALRGAVAVVDPAGECTAWQAACRIERELSSFDRRGDLRAGRRAPRSDLEVALLALCREEVTGSARTLYRALTTLSETPG